jgi:hypothetical protein
MVILKNNLPSMLGKSLMCWDYLTYKSQYLKVCSSNLTLELLIKISARTK